MRVGELYISGGADLPTFSHAKAWLRVDGRFLATYVTYTRTLRRQLYLKYKNEIQGQVILVSW